MVYVYRRFVSVCSCSFGRLKGIRIGIDVLSEDSYGCHDVATANDIDVFRT